ncbi:hypothetical protein C8Q76DRAFT_804135 [Earliella scabrosa]|nr:hypothetical protein C8Q76DRAFT_804135 [Earliella scabrosa]
MPLPPPAVPLPPKPTASTPALDNLRRRELKTERRMARKGRTRRTQKKPHAPTHGHHEQVPPPSSTPQASSSNVTYPHVQTPTYGPHEQVPAPSSTPEASSSNVTHPHVQNGSAPSPVDPNVGDSATPSGSRKMDVQAAIDLADRYLATVGSTRPGILTPLAPPTPSVPTPRQCYCDLHCDFDDISDLTSVSDIESQLGRWQANLHQSQWKRKSDTQRVANMAHSYERLATKHVHIARQPANTAHFPCFSLKEAVDTPTGQADDVQEPDGDWTVFDGDVPRRAVSRDGYELVFHMPRAFRGQTLTNLHDDILEWSRAVPLNTKGKNDRPECYVQEYDTKGASKLALLWHAVGHKKDQAVVGADIRKTGASFEGAIKLLSRLKVVTAYAMQSLLEFDPLQYGLLKRVYQYRLSEYPSQALFAQADQGMMWECREIMFNRWSPRHWDKSDPHWAWAAITYVGDFVGATFRFPQLRLQLTLQPGDMVFFRGRDLLHEVPPWLSGQRHFLVHFTHQALWTEAGFPCASSPAPLW